MATERLPMRTIREILRQKWQLGRSNRAVAQSVGVSVGAMGGALQRARDGRTDHVGRGRRRCTDDVVTGTGCTAARRARPACDRSRTSR